MAKYRDLKFAIDALARFDWSIEPSLVRFDPAELTAEEWTWAAQRPSDVVRAEEMSEIFMPALAAGVIVVETPDGFRCVTDGLTRCLAARLAHEPVWALWFKASEEQAAAVFRLKNGKAVKLSTPMDGAYAARTSQYVEQLETDRILKRYGCDLARSKRWREGAIRSDTVVEAIYAVGNGWLLDRTLEVVTTCWGCGRQALSVEVLHGTALFIGHFAQYFNTAQWRHMMTRFTEEASLKEVLETALANHKAYRGSLAGRHHYFEVELIKLYNKRRADPNRLEERSASSLAKDDDLAKLAHKWKLAHRANETTTG